MRNNDNKKNNPIKDKKDVKRSNDEHIDQDFPGFPDAPSSEKNINPKTEKEKKEAGLNLDEADSDGSASAFSSSENVDDDDIDNYSRKNK